MKNIIVSKFTAADVTDIDNDISAKYKKMLKQKLLKIRSVSKNSFFCF